jgi:signal transduction histidine kinase
VFLSGLFSALIWISIESTDDQVRQDLLQAHSLRLVENFSKTGRVYQKNELVGIQVLLEGRELIEDKWLNLAVGVHEDNVAMTHIAKILLEIDNNTHQVILIHIPFNGDVLDKNEFSVQLILVLISLAVTLIGSLVGIVLAKNLASPVRELSYRITHTDPNNPTFEPLDRLDEFGEISHAFAKTLLKISQVIEREKQFSAYVSHELRTPVAVIKSSIELSKTCREQPSSESRKRIEAQALSRMSIANSQMEILIQTFLYLGKSTNFEIVSCKIDIVPLMKEKIMQYRSSYRNKNIDISQNIPAYFNVICNEKVFDLILENILRNSFSYCAGSISLILTTDGFSIYNDIDQLRIEKAEHFGFGLKIVEDLCVSQGWSFSSGIDQSNQYLTTIQFDNSDDLENSLDC